MINSYSPLGSTSGLTSASTLRANTNPSTTQELLASFKDIFALMQASSGTTAEPGQQTGMGMSDMMAPLMLMLLEKLIAQQIDQTQTTPGDAAVSDQAARPEPSGRPVGGTLTQDFHTGHNGLDFGVPVGTPVKSTMDGKVVYSGWNDQGYGNLVIVENGAFRTYYAHLSSIPVSMGDQVAAGSVIGLSGNTGNSTGPHLHYEIRKNRVAIDPTAVTLGANA